MTNQNFAGVLETCRTFLTDSANLAERSFWIEVANRMAKEDLLMANQLWDVMMSNDPSFAKAFLAFSFKHNKVHDRRDSRIAKIIQRAHVAHASFKGEHISIDDGLGNKKYVPKSVIEGQLEIDGESKSLDQWLAAATDACDSAQLQRAHVIFKQVCIASEKNHVLLGNALSRLALRTKEVQFLAMLNIPVFLEGNPQASGVLRKLARVLQKKSSLAEKILRQLVQAGQNAGDIQTLSAHYIAQKKYQDAVQVWLPLAPASVAACATCASQLARSNRHAEATTLFTEVARISPISLLQHGYEHFMTTGLNPDVIESLTPLLPHGSERSLSPEQLLVLKMFVRYRGRDVMEVLLSQLAASGALTRNDINRFPVKPPSAPISHRKELDRRDADIEAYLAQHLPTLARGGFMKKLIDQQPIIKPGKATSRTARSVVQFPKRGADGSSEEK